MNEVLLLLPDAAASSVSAPSRCCSDFRLQLSALHNLTALLGFLVSKNSEWEKVPRLQRHLLLARNVLFIEHMVLLTKKSIFPFDSRKKVEYSLLQRNIPCCSVLVQLAIRGQHSAVTDSTLLWQSAVSFCPFVLNQLCTFQIPLTKCYSIEIICYSIPFKFFWRTIATASNSSAAAFQKTNPIRYFSFQNNNFRTKPFSH